MSRYERHVSFGLGLHGYKSRTFERRSKRSFRRWLRRRSVELDRVEAEDHTAAMTHNYEEAERAEMLAARRKAGGSWEQIPDNPVTYFYIMNDRGMHCGSFTNEDEANERCQALNNDPNRTSTYVVVT